MVVQVEMMNKLLEMQYRPVVQVIWALLVYSVCTNAFNMLYYAEAKAKELSLESLITLIVTRHYS